MPKRQCTFCPNPATTGEHIWSNWVNPLLGEKRKYVIRQEIQGNDRSWKSVGLHHKFPVLCDPCNNIWGSNVEMLMKDVSSLMVKGGNPKVLTTEEIVTISVYSQLKAFICDYAQEEVKSYYESGDRYAFRNSLTFPSGTNIWLGWTGDHHGVFKSAYAKPPLNSPKRFHIYIFMMSIGQLVIQLTSVRWTKKSNRKFASPPFLRQGSHWDRFSIPIWPDIRGPINWPRQGKLGGDTLDQFFDRWKVVNRAD
jgi:hypothetical protein